MADAHIAAATQRQVAVVTSADGVAALRLVGILHIAVRVAVAAIVEVPAVEAVASVAVAAAVTAVEAAVVAAEAEALAVADR